MKHNQLRAIGHNIADSLASGACLMIGMYDIDIWGDARKSEGGFIYIDFLTGTASGGTISAPVAKAVAQFRDALPGLCKKHGVPADAFRTLTARFSLDSLGRRVSVAIEDKNGRRSTDDYIGMPLRRIKTLDPLGRIRTQRK